MKVCFLSSMHPALDKRVFEKEALTLSDAGYEVVHVCPGKCGEFEVRGIKVVQYTPPRGMRSRILQLPRLYKLARAEMADVYHCNEIDSWLVGILAARGRQACIFDVHEHYPSAFSEIRFPWFPSFMRPIVASLIRGLYRVLTPWTDHFILAKHSLMVDFQHAEKKVVFVQNFSRIPQDMDREVPSSKSDYFDIVHLGAIGRARGWPQLLDALALIDVPRLRLRIIGAFNDGSEDEFWRKAKRLKIDGKIEFLEWMAFSEAFEILQSSSVGLILFQPGIQNHVYASPHKFFDYMAAGLPIVAPDFAVEVSGIMQDHDVGILVDSSDPKSIASAVSFIYWNQDKAEQWGINGRQAVRSYFNWGLESRHILNLYASIEKAGVSV